VAVGCYSLVVGQTCRRDFRNGPLEHRVGVCERGRNALKHIPMLNNLSAVIEPEDVDARPIGITGPFLSAVQDDVLPFGNDGPKLNTLAGILTRHAFKVGDKRILAVRNGGVVLPVGPPTNRAIASAGRHWLKHQIVESGL